MGAHLLVARQGRLRGHGEAHEGGTVALATILTRRTSQEKPISWAYKVALRVRA